VPDMSRYQGQVFAAKVCEQPVTVHNQQELHERNQRESSNLVKSPVCTHHLISSQKDLHEHESRNPSRSPPLSHRQVVVYEKQQCDCKCLIDNVKSQFEKRFSCLETSLILRLSALESNRQTAMQESKIDDAKISSLETDLQSTMQTYDALNVRVSSLEANTHIAAQTLEDAQSCTHNLNTNIDITTRIVEEVHSQMAYLFSESRKNSSIINDIQAQLSALQEAFPQQHLRTACEEFNSESTQASKEKESPTGSPTHGDVQNESQVSSRMLSCSKEAKDRDRALSQPNDETLHSHLRLSLSEPTLQQRASDEGQIGGKIKATHSTGFREGSPVQEGTCRLQGEAIQKSNRQYEETRTLHRESGGGSGAAAASIAAAVIRRNLCSQKKQVCAGHGKSKVHRVPQRRRSLGNLGSIPEERPMRPRATM